METIRASKIQDGSPPCTPHPTGRRNDLPFTSSRRGSIGVPRMAALIPNCTHPHAHRPPYLSRRAPDPPEKHVWQRCSLSLRHRAYSAHVLGTSFFLVTSFLCNTASVRAKPHEEVERVGCGTAGIGWW